jgi:hypothetical protein
LPEKKSFSNPELELKKSEENSLMINEIKMGSANGFSVDGIDINNLGSSDRNFLGLVFGK